MGSIDQDVKDLRVYVDHEMNNLRTGLEYMMRSLKMMKQEIGKLEQARQCLRQKLIEKNTEIFSPNDSLKVKEITDTPVPDINCEGTAHSNNGFPKTTPWPPKPSHPRYKKS